MAFRRLTNQFIGKRMFSSVAGNEQPVSKLKTIKNYVDVYFEKYYLPTIIAGTAVGIVGGGAYGIVNSLNNIKKGKGVCMDDEYRYPQYIRKEYSHFEKSLQVAMISVGSGFSYGIIGGICASFLPFGAILSIPFIPIFLVSSFAVKANDYKIVKR